MEISCLLISEASINYLKLQYSSLITAASYNPFLRELTPNYKNIKFQSYLMLAEALSSTPFETISSANWLLSGTFMLKIIIPANFYLISLDCWDSMVTVGMTRMERRSLSERDCFSSGVILGLVR